MKKIYLIILISICINAFSQTIEVPERKKALLFKSTATWCGPCGWYHYVTDSIYNNHSDSILFLNGHVATSAVGDPYSGPMHNLLNAVPGNSGIPHYSVAGQWVDIWPPTYDELMGAAEIFFSQAIIANIAFNYEIVDNNITVSTTTEFFQDAEGDFLVGAMIVENNIMTYQNTGDEYVDMLQHRIQRTVLGDQNTYSFGKLWADEIASGPVTAGTKFDHLLSGTLNPDWNYDELEVIVVIWLRPTGTEEHFALSSEDVEAGNSGNSQEIDLDLGYQFVSSNLSPENSNMIEVLENNLNDNLDFVRNSQGNMLRKIGPNWVNNIGDWISTEGYLFKMAGDDMVTINGTSVDPQTSIDLHTGYQFVSYFPTMVLNALDAFEIILTVNLGFIRNSNGNVLRKIGPNWVNGIGDVSPGEGYLIKMLADDIINL